MIVYALKSFFKMNNLFHNLCIRMNTQDNLGVLGNRYACCTQTVNTDIMYPEWIFPFGNMANFQEYFLLTPPTPSQHRPLGVTLKLKKLHFLSHPTQTTWSTPNRQAQLDSIGPSGKRYTLTYLNIIYILACEKSQISVTRSIRLVTKSFILYMLYICHYI